MKVVWSPFAIDRAVEQAEYIGQDKPEAARRWLIELFATVGKLAKFPQLGRTVPELALPDFREIAFRGYRVIYRVEPRRVAILTVRHGRRFLDRDELTVGSKP